MDIHQSWRALWQVLRRAPGKVDRRDATPTALPLVAAVLIVLSGISAGANVVAASEPGFDRATCRKLALERRRLERDGVRNYLNMPPADVEARHGAANVQRVKTYIELSEKVLFRCPPHVLNATAAPIEVRAEAIAPLPVRGPAQIRSKPPAKTGAVGGARRRAGGVPLPVQRPASRRKS